MILNKPESFKYQTRNSVTYQNKSYIREELILSDNLHTINWYVKNEHSISMDDGPLFWYSIDSGWHDQNGKLNDSRPEIEKCFIEMKSTGYVNYQNAIHDIQKPIPNLSKRIELGMDREIQRQKKMGKKFMTDEEVDTLINLIISEEMNNSL